MKPNKTNNQTSRFLSFDWWIRNLILALLVGFFLPRIVRTNPAYDWLISGYAKQNLEIMRTYESVTYDDKMRMKLGNDYGFIQYIRETTPSNAVVFYPSRQQMTDSIQGQPSMFQGNMCDKLSAVRFLYPRHVVIPQEMAEHTSWSKKLTHVAVVGIHGREYLPYASDTTVAIGIFPMNPKAVRRQ